MDKYGQCARLRSLLEALDIKQQDFARSLGLTQSAISQLLSGKSRMSIETLLRISDAYRIDLNWLVMGEGRPFREHGPTKLPSQPALLPITIDSQGEPNIVLVPVRAQAGYAAHRVEAQFWEGLPQFSLPGREFREGTYRAFEVEGDSMQPTLAGGDLIVCRYVEDWRWLRHLELYVVVVEGDVLVKRVYSRLREEQRLFLLSDNAFYPPIELSGHDLVEVWSVQMRLTRQLLPPPEAAHYDTWRGGPPPVVRQ